MDGATIGAISGLLGVCVGGGIQALQSWRARRLEAESVLSALVAEVEALTRLIHHRGFRIWMENARSSAQVDVQRGAGGERVEWMQIPTNYNYWSTYEALSNKIGLLHPYYADRITRFYMLIKAIHENYVPSSPWHLAVTARDAVELLENDIALFDAAMLLSLKIASFRKAKPPRGVVDDSLGTLASNSPWAHIEVAHAAQAQPRGPVRAWLARIFS